MPRKLKRKLDSRTPLPQSVIQQIKKNELINQPKPIKYKPVNFSAKKHDDYCYAIALNLESTIMVAGCDNNIRVFDFKEGQMIDKQMLSSHEDWVRTLQFMTKSNQFISGANDGKIGIWSYNQEIEKYYLLQMVQKAHSSDVSKVIMNKKEDLIISCGFDNTIKLWFKQNEWKCSQTLTDHSQKCRFVYDICLNESCTQLVSCDDVYQIQIYQQGNDQKWRKIQRIQVEIFGYRICYINDNLFTFQPHQQSHMQIYQSRNMQFYKTKDAPINNDGYCYCQFPMQFNNDKQILLNKNGYCVNLLRKLNNDFILEWSINFNTEYVYGTMSNDFKYLITWDDENAFFQVRKEQ